MLLSAVSILVVVQSSSEIPEGLMNNPVYVATQIYFSVANKLLITLSHIIMAIWIAPRYTVVDVIGLTSIKYAKPECHYPNT